MHLPVSRRQLPYRPVSIGDQFYCTLNRLRHPPLESVFFMDYQMNVIELIKEHEGLRFHPYQCTANKTTIGYGRNLDDKGISPAEAEYLLTNDIGEVNAELTAAIPWINDLDSVRRAVLIDMAFNLGVRGLLRFVLTLDYVESGDYQKAAIEMLDSRWASQVGQRANRLAEMMQSGEWPEQG